MMIPVVRFLEFGTGVVEGAVRTAPDTGAGAGAGARVSGTCAFKQEAERLIIIKYSRSSVKSSLT